ncbi:MAG TPA: nucleotidyltransferase domain-containing protein [Chitinophagales bacterium]|nr:nucleotidyltransferase domain-containing protein [Chitinophagales bacterium]HRK27288.1 nucleotidyltransferase domain-containing protein [Chitinophagales bacterium]
MKTKPEQYLTQNFKQAMTPTLNIENIKAYLSTQPILRAWLFGSYATGTADENSDVDILVEFDYNQHIGLRYFDVLWDMEKLLQKKVDLVPIEGLSEFIRTTVEQQKVLLYER